MSKEDWLPLIAKHNGSLVVWIEQGTQKTLVDAASEGLCFALTRDWIRQFTRTRIERFFFINTMRNGVPFSYRIKQAEFSVQNVLANQAIKEMLAREKKIIAEAKRPINRTDLNKMKRLKVTISRQVYGDECTGLEVLDKASDLDFAMLHIFLDPATPHYSMFSMGRTSAAGHVVGFEFRPDITIREGEELYEFFDANLGLIWFRNPTDMENFFVQEVWEKMYKSFSFDKFKIAEFDKGAGGFGGTFEQAVENWDKHQKKSGGKGSK